MKEIESGPARLAGPVLLPRNIFSKVAHVQNSILGIGASVALLLASTAFAQPPRHYGHSIHLPPGTIAQGQLAHIPALRGYVQPVEIIAPPGARVAVRQAGRFETTTAGPLRMGLMIGPVYHLQVTNIPLQAGYEVYPTVELINRLYPPEGAKIRFPIPIQLTQEELEMALAGKFVTRVIYLQDNASALGQRADPELQDYFEAPPQDDPLQVADRLGRPMAILRMGSRVPDFDGSDAGAYGDPPVTVYPAAAGAAGDQPPVSEAAVRRSPENYPRLPLQPQRSPVTFPVGYPQSR